MLTQGTVPQQWRAAQQQKKQATQIRIIWRLVRLGRRRDRLAMVLLESFEDGKGAGRK